MDGYVYSCLKASINTMRDFCDSAEKELETVPDIPERQVNIVLRQLMWGIANANTGISRALLHIARQRKKPKSKE